MNKKTFFKLVISIFFTNLIIAQSNEYPTLGDVTIRSYSPRIILQRSEDIGGFTSGIQTKLFDGTNNWYFGNLHSDSWIVSKGDYQNPKLTILSNGNVGIGTNTPLYKLNVYGSHSDTRMLLHSVGGGGDDRQADLMLWASEPEVTYTGVGIGNNVTVSTNKGVHLLNPVRGGSFIRLLDNSMSFGVVSSEGIVKQSLNLDSQSNVGIGTSNPVTKLDVRGNISVSGENSGNPEEHGQIIFENSNHGVRRIGNIVDVFTSGGPESGITFTPRSYNPSTGSYSIMNTAMKIDSNGNVGIGTNNPNSKLSVLGSLSKLTLTGIDGVFDNLIKYGHKSDLESQTSNVNRWHGIDATITAGNASDNKLIFRLYAGSSTNLEPSDVMTLVGNGNVGIGIANPNNRLDVNGTIHSKEVKVDMTGWSDFVFKKEYNLPTLEEVEKNINEKGHLKDIPSEEDALKNGINLGEMNAKLLQKIEEMTLYLIAQEKKNLKQSQEIELLNKKLSKIEESISSKSN